MTATLLKPLVGNNRREATKAALRDLARQTGPNRKLPTILELCASLDVAKATVDMALDALEGEGVIRRRRGSGIYVTPRVDQRTLALVFGHNIFSADISAFSSLLIARCRERAMSHNENFSFFLDLPADSADLSGVPVHGDLAAAIDGGKLHGLLLVGRNSEAEERWLRSTGVPVVSLLLLRTPNTVGVDYDALIRMGVDALAADGCRKIALITPLGSCRAEPSIYQQTDLKTFAAQLKRHGLPHRAEWVWESRVTLEAQRETREELGRQAMRELFGRGRRARPDGVVIADDMLALGALASARQMGLGIGRELNVVTHANKGSPVLNEWAGQVTLLEIDAGELVNAMFDMLERLMQRPGGEEPAALIVPTLRRPAGATEFPKKNNTTTRGTHHE